MDANLLDHLHATLSDAYTLERELAAGGMSRVFVAEERALGRHVVVKVLSPDLLAGGSVERPRGPEPRAHLADQGSHRFGSVLGRRDRGWVWRDRH